MSHRRNRSPRVVKNVKSTIMDLIQKFDNWKYDSKPKMFDTFYVCQECKRLFSEENAFYTHKTCKIDMRIRKIATTKNADEIVEISSDSDNDSCYTTNNLQVVFDDQCDKSRRSPSSKSSSTKSNLTVANLERHTNKTRGPPLSTTKIVQEFLKKLIF